MDHNHDSMPPENVDTAEIVKERGLQTILLLDREGQLYCIGCSEIDGQQTNHSPPSPVVPAKNGGRLPNEASSDKQQTSASQEKRKTRDDTVTNEHVVSSIGMKAVMVPTPSSIPRLPSTQSFEIGPSTRLPVPVSALQDKLIFCISCLESCETAEEIQQWAGAIKGLSEAFVCLKKCSF
ncbi:unnamed protein product [Schistocephalus solidus]|uniref:PH_RBD domain-containing protein n=1 Tax=Schistocephalus solidus TaxID=70667 RepID=A0A183SJW9_SCHSO|nr:unnamed protein product [Schistocephalus solidus]